MTNIPKWLADIKNLISKKGSKKEQFAMEFEKATKDKENLDDIQKPFLLYLLEGTLKTFDHSDFKDAKDSIDHVIHLLKKENVTDKEWDNAAADTGAAWAAAGGDTDAAAAYAAARAANWATAAANCAANCAVWAANCANYADRAAVLSGRAAGAVNCAAAWAAEAANCAAELTWSSPVVNFFNDLAEKLLELIKGVKSAKFSK